MNAQYGAECRCHCHDVADAAPDLLAACKLTLERQRSAYTADGEATTHGYVLHAEAVAALLDAVARAEGRPLTPEAGRDF